MYTIYQGESLLIPATVTGDKNSISNLSAVMKASKRGEVPDDDAATVATLSVADYTSPEVTSGYLFSLVNTDNIVPGIYYVNYKFTAGGFTVKGNPFKVVVKPSVI